MSKRFIVFRAVGYKLQQQPDHIIILQCSHRTDPQKMRNSGERNLSGISHNCITEIMALCRARGEPFLR